ncbi:hypothetical protein [Chryseobacterium sp. GP-SGM7]|uniref:hypothetical protein n=1 Tax=Chryseobacterium sp. GP-SGM7 TaxID=3411323 RepID=UPI003B958378
MNKILIALLFSIAVNFTAQDFGNKDIGDINRIFLPPPTANNLMKFEEVPISYYTGIPDISIPLFNIPTNSKDINLNAQLKYHPLSAKPKDKAGEQGLGWNLVVGGSITRTVRGGAPDEKNISKNDLTSQKTKYGIYNQNNNPTYQIIDNNAVGLNTSEYAFNAAMGRYDTEYDLYQYNFMGYTGRFYVKKEGAGRIVEKLDKNNLKITCKVDNLSQEITEFVVIDDKGVKYTFNVIEKSSQTVTTIKIGLHNQTPMMTSNFDPGNYPVSYLLGKVDSPSDDNLLLFTYDLNANINYEEAPNLVRRNAYNIFYNDDDPILNFNVDTSIPGSLESSTVHNISQTKILTSIIVKDRAKIILTYEKGREDSNYQNPQDLYKLKTIESQFLGVSNNSAIKKYEFNYKYSPQIELLPIDGPSKQLKKLLLDKVTEINFNGQNNEYKIEYFDTSIFSTSVKEDRWGYFESPYTFTNIVKSIQYPTKGKVEFNFEENDYSSYPTIDDEVGDINTNMQSVKDYIKLTPIENSLGYSDFSITKKEFFTISSSQTVRISCYYGNLIYYPWTLNIFKKNNLNQYVEVHRFDEHQQQPTSPGGLVSNPYPSGTPLITEKELYIPLLEPGIYYMTLNSPSIFSSSNLNSTFVAHTSENTLIEQKKKKGGGIRISEILYYNDVNNHNPAKKKVFNYQNITNPLLSSGSLVFPEPLYFYNDNFNLLYTQDNQYGFTHHNVQYNAQLIVTTNYNLLPIQKTQGSDVGYQYVTIEDIDLQNNKKGKTVHKFRSPLDFPNQSHMFTVMPIVPIANQDYLRGQLFSTKVYDANNNILSEIENQYTSTEYERNDGIKIKDNFYNNIITKNYKYDTYQEFVNHIGSNVILISPYKNFEKFGVTLPIQKIEKSYFYKNGVQSSVSATTNTLYNSLDYPTSVTQLFSDGDSNVASYKYAYEKGNTRLINANMVGVPLEKENKKNNNVITKVETFYNDVNHYLPTSLATTDLSGVVITEVIYDKYDSNGNLLQYTTKDGVVTSIIWGYNFTQPIAKIVGASYDEVSPLASEIISASDTDINTATEQILIDKLDIFRNSVHSIPRQYSQVATYTYDPLIGVTSITPPSGIREIYKYDSANRLEKIVDEEGKILKEFKYNYKP